MEQKDLSDYLDALWRHKVIYGIIFGTVLLVGLTVALLLPAVYRSTATILIEEQEIPTDLVRSTITSYAAQRLQTINQRVMTRANLLTIVEKFSLYGSERQQETLDEIVERMRNDINFETVSADVIDPRSGRPTQATIAFTLSYDSHHPELAQKVANEITSLYLEENLKNRTQKTAEAADFLKEEVNQIAIYSAELENRLAKFKEEHTNQLPDQRQANMQALDRTETEIKDVDMQIRTLRERNALIDSQLMQIPPESPVISSTGERIMSSADRLRALRTQHAALVAQYSDKHPDVTKTRQEIAALEREVGDVDASGEQSKRLEQLRADRATLSDKYAGNHPDIAALDKKIAALERAVRTPRAGGRGTALQQPDNPAYLNLQAQKEGNLLEIAGLMQRRNELKAKLQQYEDWIHTSPDVERQYMALARDWENAANRYRELKAKQMEAQIAEQLERKSKGERFSVVEPALLPERPLKPNRPVIVLLSFILASGAATGYVGLLATLDKAIRKPKHIFAVAGVAPLAVIPYLGLDEEIAARNRRALIIVGAVMGVILLSLALLHWLGTPLDVLWFRAVRRLGTLLH